MQETDTGPDELEASKTDDKPVDKQARLEALIKELERAFVRHPAQAKQTAVTLSVEFPDRFDAAWVLNIYSAIDAAQWRKAKVDEVLASWDSRPGYAKGVIIELRARYRQDSGLKRWASAMVKQIDQHQRRLRLDARIREWDRLPGDAQAAAREANKLWPRQYPLSWLRKFEQQVWEFQDVKWAEKVSAAELTAALGDNVIDWQDAPLEVKQELQIRLGREKAAQAYGKNGNGAGDTRDLELDDAARTEVLDDAARVAPKDSGFTGFTKKEDLPVKRLEVTARTYDQKSDELTRAQTSNVPPPGNPLLARQPDVMTTILNDVLAKQAQQYRERGAAYRTLATAIKSGKTTIAAERELMRRDLQAIDTELRNQYPQLRAYEKQAKDDASVTVLVTGTRTVIEQLEQHEKMLEQVLADPTGVVPSAGQIAVALPGPSFTSADPVTTAAKRDVANLTDGLESVTGGDQPVGIQRNFQEMGIGLTRFSGRIQLFNAGVFRLAANLGSYVLPVSVTASLTGLADQSRALGLALAQANTKSTKDGEASQMTYTAAGGEIPMIDRVFSTQKIFEKPDVAILAMLQAMPQTKGVSLALQVGITGAQTLEAFFASYGQTGQLEPALQAAGWSAIQGAAGIVLDKLGLPASGSLVANIALVYGFGKLRGLSNDQIAEEIAFTLVGAAVGAATAKVRSSGAKPLEGVAAKSKEIVAALDDAAGAKSDDDAFTESTPDKSRSDAAAGALATAIETSQRQMRELQALQQSKAPTKQKLAEIKQSTVVVDQKRAALREAMASKPTEPTSKSIETTLDAVVEPTEPTTDAVDPTDKVPTTETVKATETKLDGPRRELEPRLITEDARPWLEAEDGRQIFRRADESFVDQNGRVTDSDGMLIDTEGRLIDIDGRWVDAAGRRVNEYGQRIDETGKLIEDGEQPKLSNREATAKLFREKFGDKVIAYRGIRVPKGTKVNGTYQGGSKLGQMVTFTAESALHYARIPAYEPPGGRAGADEIVVIQFELTAELIVHDEYGTLEHVFVDTDITKLPGYKESRVPNDKVTDANQAFYAAQIQAGRATLESPTPPPR